MPQTKSDQERKDEKLILEEDLIKAESSDQPELELASGHKQTATNFLLNKFEKSGNGVPLGLNFLKHLPPQPFSSASSSNSIFANPFGSPSTLAKAAALISKPRALGANFVQRFPGFLNNAASASHQIGPVYSPNAASSNIVLQQTGPHNVHPNQLFNQNGPPPQQNHHFINNNGRPTNQINNLPPLLPAENTIDLQELGLPFFENAPSNHIRHNEREHNLQMPPPPNNNNNGPMTNDNQNGPPIDQAASQFNINNDWSSNNHKQMAIDKPKITHLDVKCEKNLMKVFIEFSKPFNGVIFSKGHYSYPNCVHLQSNTGRQQASFDIMINQCGTTGNTQNGFYGYGAASGSGTFFENTVVVQYDPQVQVK